LLLSRASAVSMKLMMVEGMSPESLAVQIVRRQLTIDVALFVVGMAMLIAGLVLAIQKNRRRT